MSDPLSGFNQEEKEYLLELLRRFSEEEALEKFTLWGKLKYQYAKYRLPNFLSNIDSLK